MYLFFDTETTGRPQNRDAPASDLDNWPRLVQLGWVFYDAEEHEVDTRNLLIQPHGYTIPEEATEIHGITTERAINEGIPLRLALFDFASVLENAQILVAHNIDFDAKVVEAEFIRENIPNNLPVIAKVCTMKKSTDFCRLPGTYGYKYPTLSELHLKLFPDVPYEYAHDAMKDAQTCAKCFFELKRRGIITLSH